MEWRAVGKWETMVHLTTLWENKDLIDQGRYFSEVL
jgi:hypothetical protein